MNVLSMGAARRLILQDPPPSIKEVSEEFGVSRHIAMIVRDLVYLDEEPDLTGEEIKAIYESWALVADNKLAEIKRIIDPIMGRRFGQTMPPLPGGPAATREHHRTKFRHSVSSLADTMSMSRDLEVPYLPAGERTQIAEDLREAVKAIEDLISTIELGGSHNVVSR